MKLNEITENALNKSVNNQKEKVIRVKEKTLKNFIKASIVIIGLSSVGIVQAGNSLANHINKAQVVGNSISEARNFVHSSVHRTADNMNYYYNTDQIADYILKNPESKYEKIYAVFTTIGYNEASKNEQMDIIIKKVFENENGDAIYNSFNQFLIENGFVDKDGNPSKKDYEEKMKEYIFAKEELKEQEDNIKGIK